MARRCLRIFGCASTWFNFGAFSFRASHFVGVTNELDDSQVVDAVERIFDGSVRVYRIGTRTIVRPVKLSTRFGLTNLQQACFVSILRSSNYVRGTNDDYV